MSTPKFWATSIDGIPQSTPYVQQKDVVVQAGC